MIRNNGQEHANSAAHNHRSRWLPTAVLEGNRPASPARELAVILGEAYQLAGHAHYRLRRKLTLVGALLGLPGVILLALYGASDYLNYPLIAGPLGDTVAVSLLVTAAAFLVYGRIIHKPLLVAAIRKTWWRVYLLPSRSGHMALDSCGVAPTTQLVVDDIPLTEIRSVVRGMPEGPGTFEDERRLNTALAAVGEFSGKRKTVAFQTAALETDNCYATAVVSLTERLQPGRPSVSAWNPRLLSLEEALAQRDRLEAIEASESVVSTLQATVAELETKVREFTTGLENSERNVQQYNSAVRTMLAQRWLGTATVQSSPTTLSNITTDRGRPFERAAQFSYIISPLTVAKRDDSGRFTALSLLEPVIDQLERRIEAGVVRTVEHAAKEIEDKRLQAEASIRRLEGESKRRIRNIQQEADRSQREADRLGHQRDLLSRSHNRARARASAARDRSQMARYHQNFPEMQAQEREFRSADEEAERSWRDMSQVRREMDSKLELARNRRMEANTQREELRVQVARARGELTEDIHRNRQAITGEVRLERRHADALYVLRDRQLGMLLEVDRVLETELEAQRRPFRERKQAISQASARAISSLNSRKEERKNAIDKVRAFHIPQGRPELPIEVHIPFWLVTMGDAKARRRMELAFPPRRLQASDAPRDMEKLSPLSPSLETIAGQVAHSAAAASERIALPLQGAGSQGLAQELDSLVSCQFMSKGYARSVKKFFGLQ